MKMRFFLYFFILYSVCSYSQWISQNSGTGRHLYGLDVVDSNVIYCSAQLGENVKTTNGGQNWFSILPPYFDDYNNCSFLNANTGVFVGPGGVLIRTTDGGASWTIRYHPVSGLGDVQFVNENWIYACGGGVIRSTDGGLNWILLGNFPSVLQSLYFTDSLTGTVIGTNGFIVTTTNGGLNWTQRYMMLPVQFADSSLFAIHYINSLTGYTGGNNGIIIKTTNSGVNWNFIPSGTLYPSRGIFFIDENIGFFTSVAGRIYKTTNGGINWILQTTGVTDPLYDVEFINENTGWVCGFNGRILKTTNGSSTWIHPITNEVPKEFKLYQNYPNPFNPSTIIRFSIPENGKSKMENSVVILKVYDLLGREVAILVNEKLKAGLYEIPFSISQFSDNQIPSGIYFYRLSVADFSSVKKMILIK